MTSAQVDALILAIANGEKDISHVDFLALIPPLARPCNANDIFIIAGGMQCGNCLYPWRAVVTREVESCD